MNHNIQKQNSIIGIVGGVGPYAGLDLNEKIFKNTVAGADQEHLRTILMSFSSEISDRTQYLLNPETIKNPAFAISNIIAKLEKAGAEVAGIPCSTAHADAIFSAILENNRKKNLSIQLLNMVDETFRMIQAEKLHTVGLLATLGTYKTNVYRKHAAKNSIEILYPKELAEMNSVHASIYHEQFGIKSKSNPISKIAIDILLKESEKLIDRGAQAIVLGCTEIPLAMSQRSLSVATIDPTEVLARALVNSVAPEKLVGL